MIHLINSGAAALDGAGCQQADGQPVMKPFWEISEAEAAACLKATTWHAAITEYFRGGGFSSHFVTRGGMPITMCRINLVQGLGPVLQIAEGWTCELPAQVHELLDERTNPTWPTTWFAPRLTGTGAFRDVYGVMNAWGANHGAFSYGHVGADLIALAVAAADPRLHAQRAGGADLPAQRLERVRHGRSGRRRLPGLRQLRPAVRPEVVRLAGRP